MFRREIMAFFFNLENLEKDSCNNSEKFVTLLKHFYAGKLPRRYDKYKSKLSLAGKSFLLNPEPLFKSKIDIAYIVQYIKLAARRDYTLYKHYKVTSLQLSYYPDINLAAIKTNPLLKITGSEIHFLYEDKENKWH
ncbi:MAG: hypothetical protein BWY21_00107 [Parcubacteria group bacterium ADurb.Bin216]|nr:MAG: hypothetical protein BWY21_00107 [Parcubacteria group bacterium ADurb.Bin216]